MVNSKWLNGKLKNPRSGFTLVELLVVITIIGILASIGVASYTKVLATARNGRRQADLSSLRDALELYYSENNRYIAIGTTWRAVNETYLDDLTPGYIKVLPSDPGGAGREYRCRSASSAQAYCLEAYLEGVSSTQNTCRKADGSTIPLQSGYNYGVGNP